MPAHNQHTPPERTAGRGRAAKRTTVRPSAAERERLEALADECGLPLSTFLIECAVKFGRAFVDQKLAAKAHP